MKLKLLLGLFITALTYAQIPAYYQSIDFSQTGPALKSQLSTLIINTHTTELVYTSGSSGLLDTWTVLKQSDLDPTNTNNVLLIYGWNDSSTNVTEHHSRGVNESCHTSSCSGLWVREHVFPKSLGTPNLENEFAGADAHNLRAIDSQRNNSRGNKLFGAGTASVPSYSINTTSWYPGDEWRGDVARIIMYMYLRYPTQCSPNSVTTSDSGNVPPPDMPELFLEWNRLDPPSEFEIQRNNVIATNQGNRNPFIDNPYLATLIWSGEAATDTWNMLSVDYSTLENIYLYPTATKDYVYINNNNYDNLSITVYNLLGQKVEVNVTATTLDFTSLSQGVYIIKLQADNQTKTVKVYKN